jgi:hypothetical protein
MNQTTIGTADQMDGSTGVVEISAQRQLDAFIARMDAELEDSRRDLAREEALVAEKKALCAALPKTLPQAPQKLFIGSNIYKADAELLFEVTSYDDVARLVEALPGLPVLMIQAGCTAFVPEERYIHKPNQSEKIVEVGDVIYRLSSWVENLQEEFSWWTPVSNKLVHVMAKTKKGHAVNAKAKRAIKTLDLQGVLQEVTWTYENLPAGEVMQWAGGNPTSAITVTVHQPRGTSFKDALAKPQTATVKANTRRCDC